MVTVEIKCVILVLVFAVTRRIIIVIIFIIYIMSLYQCQSCIDYQEELLELNNGCES